MRVVVDEAHATGCLGPGGRGAVAEAGLEGEVDVVVGTLGKALGAYGAFAACDEEIAALLTNTARSLIFSTAPPPPAVAGALAALDVLEQSPRRVERLQANADVLRAELAREGFDVAGSSTQIVPLIVGDASTAMRVCEAALERGVFAQAIRPPTVPRGHLAAAPGRHGDAHQGRAARGRAGARPRRAAGRLPAGHGDADRGRPGGRARALRRARPSRGPRSARRAAAPPPCPTRRSDGPGPVRGCFVTGTDTGAGKTVVAAAIAAALRARGIASRCSSRS